MAGTTSLYRGLVLACERRRLQLAWPMWLLEEKAGLQDRYWPKCLYSETKSGRCTRDETIQWVIGALWPDGGGVWKVELIPDDETMRAKIAKLQARYGPRIKRARRVQPLTHLREYTSARQQNPLKTLACVA